ncbi:MarR family winged helix-turn-helix transcriptional regulator [Brevundimonas vesicularis]|uniref:MarR family winged helix-turn-helix transcriptional regulator n=1 Tax=Brevundimonas vesicularis TaxID=41276 RepID=UPI0038D3F4B4
MDPSLSPAPEQRPERPADPTASLVRSMRRIAQAIDVRSREIARQSGLTLPQLIVLQSVRALGEVTTQAISRDAAMSAPTVVGVLDKLEAKGLIERYRSTRDRRVVHTRTTPAAQAALADSPDLLGDNFIAAFRQLPVERRRELAEALDILAGFMVSPAPPSA